MKRFTLYIGAIAAAFLLNISLSQAQQSEHEKHHPKQKKVESQTEKKSGAMMGEGMMQGMHKEGNMCGMMEGKDGGMMGGNMMDGSMMKGNMMQGGMMEMMGNMSPMHTYQHTIHQLKQQAENLDLNDTQIAKLKEIQADFQKRQADLQADRKKKQIDLDLLLDKKASTSDVRKNLKVVYDLRLESEIAVYETAQKMLAVLTPEQKEKWEKSGAKGSCNMMGMMGQKETKTVQ